MSSVAARATAVTLSLLGSLFGLAAQSPPEIARQAGEAMRRGDYARAETLYKTLVKELPEVAELRSNLGVAQYIQGKLELAAQSFEEALAHDTDLPTPNFFLGRIYFETTEFDKAVSHLGRAQKGKPDELEVQRLLAAALMKSRRFDEAAAQYETLLQQDEKDVDALYGLGIAYLRLGEEAFQQLADHTDSPFYHLALAESYLDQSGWLATVQKAYQTAIEKSPALPGPRVGLGMTLLTEDKWATAETLFKEELDLDPWSYEALFGLCLVQLSQNNWSEAAISLQKAAAIRPEFFELQHDLPVAIEAAAAEAAVAFWRRDLEEGRFAAAYLLIHGYRALDRPADAEQAEHLAEVRRKGLLNALKADKASPPVADSGRRSAGLELLRRKRYEQSVQILEGLMSERPADPQLGNAVLRGKLRAGHVKEAISLFGQLASPDTESWSLVGHAYRVLAEQKLQEIFLVDPESWRAFQLQGDALYAKSQYSEAIEAYEQAVEKQSNTADLLFSLANAYFRDSQLDLAAETYSRVLQVDRRHADASLMRATVLLQLNRQQEAIRVLESALELNGELVDPRSLLARTLAALGKSEEALAHYERVAQHDRDGTIHYQLASLYRKLGRLEESKEALSRSSELRKKGHRVKELN